jgi:spermidine/putrescine-binding protein
MSSDERVSLAFIWDVTSPRFSRRSFMKTAAFASAAGFIAACGSSSSSGKSGTTVKQSEAKVLNFYNWTDYVDPDHTIPDFQKQTGIKVTYDNYSSNDELLAKMQTGNTGYDLIVPTDATLVKMKHGGLIQKIDLSKIPNVNNLDPRFRDAEYDPGNEYSIPWQWGTTVTDWDGLKLAAVKGKSSYLDEARDAFAMALFALGHDPNTLDDKQLDDAKNYLIDLKKNIKAITSDYQDPLKSGELIMSQAYSGDVFQIQADNDKVEYIIPKSGAFSWVDSMAIPKGATHVDNAHAFMNYILDPHVGATLTNFTQYGSPNKAALPFIDKDLLKNPLVFPSQAELAKLPFQKDLGEDEIKYSDRWTQVKAS